MQKQASDPCPRRGQSDLGVLRDAKQRNGNEMPICVEPAIVSGTAILKDWEGAIDAEEPVTTFECEENHHFLATHTRPLVESRHAALGQWKLAH